MNPLEALPTAGKTFVGRDESVAYCLQHEPPKEIPAHLKKFSSIALPGQRHVHHGYADIKFDSSKVFGSFSVPNSNTAEALDMSKPPMVQYLEDRAEQQYYKSVRLGPLGHVHVESTVLPGKAMQPSYKFGKPSFCKSDGSAAKEVIFPLSGDPKEEEKEVVYRKSHSSYPPGEQRSHGLDWAAAGVDPSRFAFGESKKLSEKDRDGLAKCLNPDRDEGLSKPRIVPKSVEDFRAATADRVGLRRGVSLVDSSKFPASFGKPSRTNRDGGDWGAADCLRGDYSQEDQAPDRDLGKSVHAGSRLPDPDKRFGLPSIRLDVPPRGKQSLATMTDFGSDAGAAALLSPSVYAGLGVDEKDFTVARPLHELLDVFASIGYNFSLQEGMAIYAHAGESYNLTPRGSVSVEEFRRAVDELLEAQEVEGKLPAWFTAGPGAAAGAAGATMGASGAARRGH